MSNAYAAGIHCTECYQPLPDEGSYCPYCGRAARAAERLERARREVEADEAGAGARVMAVLLRVLAFVRGMLPCARRGRDNDDTDTGSIS